MASVGTIRTAPPVWREGERIRRGDGTGYSDRVTDDEIRQHAIAALVADQSAGSPAAAREGRDAFDTYWFAMATLALREWERARGEATR